MRAEVDSKATMTGSEAAAAALVAGLPRDQALGLRLLCLARAAASLHMGQACAPMRGNCATGAPSVGSVSAEARP